MGLLKDSFSRRYSNFKFKKFDSVECLSAGSQNFFISSEKSTQTMSLVKLLGNEMEFFLREQIEQIVSDYFSEPNSLGLL